MLRQPLPHGVSIVAYADDIALIIVGKTIEDVQYLRDMAIEVVGNWLSDHGLNLAAEKTEAVLIARTKKKVYATFTVIDEKIKTKDAMKYLGVTIDVRMSFKDHFRVAGLKVSEVARALAGVMPNIGGPKQPRRLLLASVVYSVILYGAPIWAHAICSNPCYGTACRRPCRIIALRVASAYRTVSDIALSVVAGLAPLYLMACERAEVYSEGVIREEGDFDQGPRRNRWSRKTVEEWQRRWDIADKGRWTHRIIPCVLEWQQTLRCTVFYTFSH